jgi:hypothetical protein
MTNRVVSFVYDPAEALAPYLTRSEAGDCGTMPDELDMMQLTGKSLFPHMFLSVHLFMKSWKRELETRAER